MDRCSGVLLHITSLPSHYGIGDLGPAAYEFIDFLREARQSIWQILPVNPTDPALGNSPYSSVSAFASNPLMISPEMMVRHGYLESGDIHPVPQFDDDRVEYEEITAHRDSLFRKAFERFKRGNMPGEYADFCREHAPWLDDYALFVVIKASQEGRVWNKWPAKLRDRNEAALAEAKEEHADQIEYHKFLQYLFFQQWFELKEYAHDRSIRIMGDVPIYVSYDCADVWCNTEIFKLNSQKEPDFVAGVPPDYFSKTGQLWGNPVYDWDYLKETDFQWWMYRMRHSLHLYDLVRIDHFRGLVAYWEVPANEKTAINGQWIAAPADDFFTTLLREFPENPVVAEDLGFITDDVVEIVEKYNFPGMKLLLFAFGEDNPEHPYLPHNYIRNCVVYTGTHDNNTVRGWFEDEAEEEDRQRLFEYLGRTLSPEQAPWELVRCAMMSVADTAIFPIQDILGLGASARMNIPSTAKENWTWRLQHAQVTTELAQRLADVTQRYGRATAEPEAD